MFRRAVSPPPAKAATGGARITEVYWSILNGEFPYCLDDSEATGTPSELIGYFDLVVARQQTRPNTSWISYAELFLSETGSLLVFCAPEALDTYISAVQETGLDYRGTLFYQENGALGVILWAGRDNCFHKPLPAANLLTAPEGVNDERAWLMERLVDTFTRPETAVLEPFLQDSLLLAACQNLRRYCLAITRKRSLIKQTEQEMISSLRHTA